MKYELFPTPVWHIEGAPQELVDELYKGAYACKESRKGNILSNQGGYQSPSFNWDKFHPEGIKYIEGVLKKELKELTEFSLHVKHWWININPTGTWNTPHTHPTVHFAAILYLTDTQGELCFVSHTNRVYDDAYVGMNTKKGDLLVFPSDQIHFVLPNESEKDRVCISMNITV